MPATRLTEVERAYFRRKAGGALPSEPFNNLKRRYIAGFVGGVSPSIKMHEMEALFLTKIISDAGGTPTSPYVGDLWRQAVAAIGQVPSKYEADNKIKFYLNAP